MKTSWLVSFCCTLWICNTLARESVEETLKDLQDWTTAQELEDGYVTPLTSLPKAPGQVAVLAGRLFFTFLESGWPGVEEGRLNEFLFEEKRFVGYPDALMQKELGDASIQLVVDSRRGWLFVISSAGMIPHQVNEQVARHTSIRVIDVENNRVIQSWKLPSKVTGRSCRVTSAVIDSDSRYLFLACVPTSSGGTRGIVVVDVHIWKAWRVLDGFSGLDDSSMRIKMQNVALELPSHMRSVVVAVDSNTLVFSALLGEYLYRIPLSVVTKAPSRGDEARNHDRVEKAVERFAPKSAASAILIHERAVYMSDVEHSAVNVLDMETFALTTLVSSQEKLRWPASLAHDGSFLYIASSCFHLVLLSQDFERWAAPFFLYRVPLRQPPKVEL